jgi:hypothetical protein
MAGVGQQFADWNSIQVDQPKEGEPTLLGMLAGYGIQESGLGSYLDEKPWLKKNEQTGTYAFNPKGLFQPSLVSSPTSGNPIAPNTGAQATPIAPMGAVQPSAVPNLQAPMEDHSSLIDEAFPMSKPMITPANQQAMPQQTSMAPQTNFMQPPEMGGGLGGANLASLAKLFFAA